MRADRVAEQRLIVSPAQPVTAAVLLVGPADREIRRRADLVIHDRAITDGGCDDQVVVIGIGNVIRSDDGLGVHAVRRLLERRADIDDVELVEGGTAGLMLLPHLAAARRAIIVDAIGVGAPPGTLVRLDGEGAAFRLGATPHDAGLANLVDAAHLTGAWPDELVLHGAQPGSTAIGTDLTPPVAAALERLADAVEAELAL